MVPIVPKIVGNLFLVRMSPPEGTKMLYQVLLAVGGLGLLAQAGLGFTHSEGGHSESGHSIHNEGHTESIGHNGFLLLSPLRIFGFCLGMGGGGLVLLKATSLSAGPVFALAVLVGWAFYRLIVKPLLVLVLRFASKPATTLSGALGQEASADSRFDATGQGIVTLVVDGHLVRLLATLEGEPQPIEAGEKLQVVAIDTRRNRATVTKL
jgi:hypothetical protein